MSREIDRAGVERLVEAGDGAVLVEALPEKYFREGHLPSARHLPLDGLEGRAAATLPDKDAAIVVYCASATCQNSHQAAERLARLGYGNVAVYAGGKKDWTEAGLALEV